MVQRFQAGSWNSLTCHNSIELWRTGNNQPEHSSGRVLSESGHYIVMAPKFTSHIVLRLFNVQAWKHLPIKLQPWHATSYGGWHGQIYLTIKHRMPEFSTSVVLIRVALHNTYPAWVISIVTIQRISGKQPCARSSHFRNSAEDLGNTGRVNIAVQLHHMGWHLFLIGNIDIGVESMVSRHFWDRQTGGIEKELQVAF